MPNLPYRILIVAPTHDVAERILPSVAGHDVVLRTDFASARAELDRQPPDLLISQVRLGALEGPPPVIRAQGPSRPTQTLVGGRAWRVLETQTRSIHARYLPWPVV